jgi:hypothetical protein
MAFRLRYGSRCGTDEQQGREVLIYTRAYSIYYTSKLRGKNFIAGKPSIIRGDAKPG